MFFIVKFFSFSKKYFWKMQLYTYFSRVNGVIHDLNPAFESGYLE